MDFMVIAGHLPCVYQSSVQEHEHITHSTLSINSNGNNTYLCCESVMLVASQIVEKQSALTCVPVVHLYDNTTIEAIAREN